MIKSAVHHQCVDVPSNSEQAVDLQTFYCHGQTNQQWTFAGSDRNVRIRSVRSGLCWFVSSTQTGTRLRQGPCRPVPETLARFSFHRKTFFPCQDSGVQLFTWNPAHSDKCVGLFNPVSKIFSLVQQTCTEQAHQLWYVW
jgi:hypothetical protein